MKTERRLCRLAGVLVLMWACAPRRLPAADRYWAAGDGNWDITSTNWHPNNTSGDGSVLYADDDRVYVSGSDTSNRKMCSINIVNDVAPGFLQVQAGYGCGASLSGADITGTLDMQANNQNTIQFLRAFSFTGTVNVGSHPTDRAHFRFQPATPASLTQSVNVPANTAGQLFGNAHADWSLCDCTVGDGSTVWIPATGETAAHYTGLVLLPAGDMTLSLAAHYQSGSKGCFNGRIDGPDSVVTLNGHTGMNWWGVIRGPGAWGIAGLVKNTGFDVDVYASNICGASLDISAGRLRLQAGTVQEVSVLTITGVVQTAYGTYGSTASGADYPNDDHFLGSGVVTLVPPPGTVMVVQ